MRSLKRNKRKLYYCLYEGVQDVVDENDNIVGRKVRYSAPVEFWANIMPKGGEAVPTAVGISENYSVKISTTDMRCPIRSDAVLFIESEPSFDEDDNPLYDHVVTNRAETINAITFYAERVKVS